MSWRREDYGYATAAVAAVALVAYLVAGNFGLVPSPLSPRGHQGAGLPEVAQAGTSPAGQNGAGLPVVPAVAPGTAGTTPGVSSPSAIPPQASILTASGLSVGLLDQARVQGTATDGGPGVREVVVNFYSSGVTRSVTADLECSDDGRTDCTWSARVPQLLATYQVVAYAVNSDGAVGSSDPIEITTVNTGATLEGPVDLIVEDVPEILEDLVESLPETLQSTARWLFGLLSGG